MGPDKSAITPASRLKPTGTRGKAAASITNWKTPALMGYLVLSFSFVVVGTWSASARLDRAVVFSGTVTNETNRKTIEHLEEGMIKEIRVKEGQHVKKGDVLVRLASLQAIASSDLVHNQLGAAIVLEARLSAELDGRDTMPLPSDLEQRRKKSSELAKVVDDQENQFRERRASLNAEVALYNSKITELKTEIAGIAVKKSATEKQVSYIDEELVGLRELRQKNLIPISRALAMERERTRLEGIVGQSVADAAEADKAINEARLEIAELRQKVQEEVSAQLLETRQKINDLREKASVADDILARQDVLAPRTGTVQNLKVFTIGQVIRPAEAMMDIIPDDEKLVIHAQLPTPEIGHIREGMTAEIRFPAFRSRRTPIMLGTLDNVSRDRLVDEATKRPYFLGIISLGKAKIPETYRNKIRAGMPAEVIITTEERTALSYLVSPLRDSLRRSFRE